MGIKIRASIIKNVIPNVNTEAALTSFIYLASGFFVKINLSTTLSIAVLDKLFLENGLIYDFYKQVLEDLETMYLYPVKTYEIYKKYGIIA